MIRSLSFVGPAMSDAISNLGGGGLSSPYLANLANALDYASGCLMTLVGGPIINKFGIRWSCMIAALTMPLGPSSYYVAARYNVDWYLLFSKVYPITPLRLKGHLFQLENSLTFPRFLEGSLGDSYMSARRRLCSHTHTKTIEDTI